eukprot:GHVL01036233.1.p2 GENE.GHVL01036233.1~~GHVL01036233.1.p2  ORF type:complete len:498 (+),score=115.30 GHVL01036233.1:1359-2852(+)
MMKSLIRHFEAKINSITCWTDVNEKCRTEDDYLGIEAFCSNPQIKSFYNKLDMWYPGMRQNLANKNRLLISLVDKLLAVTFFDSNTSLGILKKLLENIDQIYDLKQKPIEHQIENGTTFESDPKGDGLSSGDIYYSINEEFNVTAETDDEALPGFQVKINGWNDSNEGLGQLIADRLNRDTLSCVIGASAAVDSHQWALPLQNVRCAVAWIINTKHFFSRKFRQKMIKDEKKLTWEEVLNQFKNGRIVTPPGPLTDDDDEVDDNINFEIPISDSSRYSNLSFVPEYLVNRCCYGSFDAAKHFGLSVFERFRLTLGGETLGGDAGWLLFLEDNLPFSALRRPRSPNVGDFAIRVPSNVVTNPIICETPRGYLNILKYYDDDFSIYKFPRNLTHQSTSSRETFADESMLQVVARANGFMYCRTSTNKILQLLPGEVQNVDCRMAVDDDDEDDDESEDCSSSDEIPVMADDFGSQNADYEDVPDDESSCAGDSDDFEDDD